MTTEEKIIGKTPKSQRTKDRIYHSALDILAEQGFEGATIRDICKHSGVSIGTFYSYFNSKNDILFEFFRNMDNHFTHDLAPKITGETYIEKIRCYFKLYSAMCMDANFDTMCMLFSTKNIWFARIRPTQKVLINLISKGQEAGEISKRMPAQEICEFLFVLIRGLVFQWCSENAAFELWSRADLYIATAMSSLLTDPLPYPDPDAFRGMSGMSPEQTFNLGPNLDGHEDLRARPEPLVHMDME